MEGANAKEKDTLLDLLDEQGLDMVYSGNKPYSIFIGTKGDIKSELSQWRKKEKLTCSKNKHYDDIRVALKEYGVVNSDVGKRRKKEKLIFSPAIVKKKLKKAKEKNQDEKTSQQVEKKVEKKKVEKRRKKAEQVCSQAVEKKQQAVDTGLELLFIAETVEALTKKQHQLLTRAIRPGSIQIGQCTAEVQGKAGRKAAKKLAKVRIDLLEKFLLSKGAELLWNSSNSLHSDVVGKPTVELSANEVSIYKHQHKSTCLKLNSNVLSKINNGEKILKINYEDNAKDYEKMYMTMLTNGHFKKGSCNFENTISTYFLNILENEEKSKYRILEEFKVHSAVCFQDTEALYLYLDRKNGSISFSCHIRKYSYRYDNDSNRIYGLIQADVC